MMRRLRLRPRPIVATVVVAAGLALAGCSAPTAGLEVQTSQAWQSRVLAIAESAEAGDVASALTELDALETETTQARADGDISAERAAIIQQSIAAVRSDLEGAVPEPVAPVPEDTTVTDRSSTDSEIESDSDDKGGPDDKSDDGRKDDDKGGKGGKGDNGEGGKDRDDG